MRKTMSATAESVQISRDPQFQALLERWQARIERELAARLPPATARPTRLHEALRYSALGGGKRVRPMLVYATGERARHRRSERRRRRLRGGTHPRLLARARRSAGDGRRRSAPRPADLPQGFRRGDGDPGRRRAAGARVRDARERPGIAVTTPRSASSSSGCSPSRAARGGMAGGQALDLAAVGRRLSLAEVEEMHERKTGALIHASRDDGGGLRRASLRSGRAGARRIRARHRPRVPDPGRLAGHRRRRGAARQSDRRGSRPRQADLSIHASASKRRGGACMSCMRARSRRSLFSARAQRRWRALRTGWCSESTEPFTVDSRSMGSATPYPLLTAIGSPADLRALTPAKLKKLAGELRAVPHRHRRADGRPLRRRARHRRAHGRPALCLRHPARPHRVGRRPSGVSAQGADRPARQAAHHQAQERPGAVPDARRERIRHVRRRPFEHVDQRGARHGDRRRAQRPAAPRGRGHRRRRAQRRHGVRSAESRRQHGRRHARHPQRQRHVDLGERRRVLQLLRARAVRQAVRDAAQRRQESAEPHADRVGAGAPLRGARERHGAARHDLRGDGLQLHRARSTATICARWSRR